MAAAPPDRSSRAPGARRSRMILRALDWLSRHGAWVIAAGLFVGLALPDLARLCKPALGPVVFVLLVATVLRIDWSKTLSYARNPTVAALMLAWLLVAAPLLVWGVTRLL